MKTEKLLKEWCQCKFKILHFRKSDLTRSSLERDFKTHVSLVNNCLKIRKRAIPRKDDKYGMLAPLDTSSTK